MYQHVFKEALDSMGRGDIDPALAEGVARLEHGTLDHLSRDALAMEARITVAMIEEAGLEAVRSLADSYGLLKAEA